MSTRSGSVLPHFSPAPSETLDRFPAARLFSGRTVKVKNRNIAVGITLERNEDIGVN